jgi:hypothetical protein
MREPLLWGTMTLFLLAALFSVHARRELYEAGREIGVLASELRECARRNDNQEIRLVGLRSPGELARRAEELGVEISEPGAARG